MFFYDKKVRYLNYYENGVRMQNAGYVKFEVRDYVCQMIICVKGPRLMGSGEARVWLLTKGLDIPEKNRKLLGTFAIRSGQGRQILRTGAENVGETGLTYRQIAGVRIELQWQQYLESCWEAEAESVAWEQEDVIKGMVWENPEETEDLAMEYEKEEEMDAAEYEEDLIHTENRNHQRIWQEWKRHFPVIHPLDDRECLKLAPKDLGILTEEERALMHNSFLLHGYYNYRHLIMWLEETPQGITYCIGIPGVFHEREQVLANMFGFERLCCQKGAPRVGSFGYYYKEVSVEEPETEN